MDIHKRIVLQSKWTRITDVPLLILSVLFIPVLIIPLLFTLDPAIDQAIDTMDWIIWSLFGLDLLLKTYLSENRLRYLRQHPFDVLVVLLPFLRPLKILRTLGSVRTLRLIRVFVTLGMSAQIVRRIAKNRGIQVSLAFALIVFIACSMLLYEAEKGGGGDIDNMGIALWWAIATLTNVGAGDLTPQTAFGKGIGVFLMISGVSIFTSLAGNLAAILLDDSDQITLLRHEISELKEMLPDKNEKDIS